jgi:hypothetical protein
MLNMGVSEEFIEKYKDELEHNKTLFDEIKERIGCEGEQANVALEFWLETYYKGMEISQVPETSMPLLYAFYAGYAYCKERYNLNE